MLPGAVLLSLLIAPVFPTWTFTAQDYFEQYDDDTVVTSTATNFGLKSDYTWDSLIAELKSKTDADDDTYYKLIFWARHGEAVHNVVKDEVGDDEWETVGTQDTYNGLVLFDDDLTSAGVSQIESLASVWSSAIANGTPSPESYYTSPLQRTLHTFELTWGSEQTGEIIEDLRERYGKYTSYERHNKTWIADNYPQFTFEDGFSEEDTLGTDSDREKKSHVQDRVKDFLKYLYKNDDNYIVSVTTHSGTIEQLLDLVDHPAYDIATGSFIPTVIKGKKT